MLLAPMLKSSLPVIYWACPACWEAAAFRQAAGSKAANQILIFEQGFDLRCSQVDTFAMASHQKLLLRCRVAVVGE